LLWILKTKNFRVRATCVAVIVEKNKFVAASSITTNKIFCKQLESRQVSKLFVNREKTNKKNIEIFCKKYIAEIEYFVFFTNKECLLTIIL